MTFFSGRPEAGFLSGISLPEQFSQRAILTPGQIAVQDEHRKVTFEELNIASAAVAARLRAMGLGGSTTPDNYDINHPEQAAVSPWVLVHTGRTVDVAIAILGVMRAGGAYILVPGGAPDAYIQQIIDTSKVSVILTDDHQVNFQVPMVYLGEDPGADIDPVLVNQSLKFVPDPLDMATAIFTSGSTGRPKGAVLEHRAISSMLAWQQAYMHLDIGEHTAAFAPFGFIAASWELLFPLAAGMTLHILSENVRHDPLALEAYFNRHVVRFVFFSPEMAELFSHNCSGESLRYVRVAGGPLRSCPETSYEILYSLGMSENGGSVTFLSIQQAYEGPIPLGKPFGPTRIYLIDDENQVVEPGETGKMALSSPSLARGYLGMAGENVEHFISNPYDDLQVAVCSGSKDMDGQACTGCAYTRLFISGDLARVDDQGMLVYEGRQDFMVKIRGMRVDPGHTEAVLAGCGGVKECVVTARQTPDNDHCLWAWAVGDGLDALQLQQKLTGLLPVHMIPERVMILPALPRGVNGKIDRTGLPEIPLMTVPGQTFYPAANHDPLLEQVCTMFARVLHVPVVNPMDSFFAWGGDSLKLARLQLLLRAEFSVDLSYSLLFYHPTPAGVLELLGSVKENSTVSSIPRAPLQPQYSLTPPMRQMFLLWHLGTDRRAYEVDTCMLIKADFNGDRLEKAFASLVEQQPMLRSRFINQGGEPALVTDTRIHYALEHLRASDLKGALTLWKKCNTLRQPFDLTCAPLFFAVRIDMEDGCCLAGLATHHILADATSLRILLDEWWQLYMHGAKTAVSDNPLSMTDVIVWEQAQADQQRNRSAQIYWKQVYDTPVPHLNLPGTAPRPDRLKNGSGVVSTSLDRDQVTALASLAKGLNLTVFQALLAVWAALLSKAADRTEGFDEVAIGVPFSGRDHPDLLSCVGMFVRTLPIRFQPWPDGSQTFADWLSIVRDLFLSAWDNQSCSLEQIVQMVNPSRIPGRSPLYDVMINLVPEPASFPVLEENGQQTTAMMIHGTNRPALFDLIFEIREESGSILLELHYARDLFQADLVQTWVESIAATAVAAAFCPEMQLCDAPWPVQDQLAQVPPAQNPIAQVPPTQGRDRDSDKVDNPTNPLSGPVCDRHQDAPKVLALVNIWKQVLNVENPGPDDDFFEQGGDSIKAIRLESRLFKAGWYLPATEIYDRAKLGDLMERIKEVESFEDEEDEFA